MSKEKKENGTKRRIVRRILMLGGVIGVMAVSAVVYLHSGRYIETDNAYVKAAKILVTPQVAGEITSVSVTDNQSVKAGDPLFTIDPSSYKIAVDEAQANLTSAKTQIEQLKAQYKQLQAELARAQVDVTYTQKEYDRRVGLVKSGAVAKSEFSDTLKQRDAAVETAAALRAQINSVEAALIGNPDIAPEDHPLYQKAQSALDNAKLNLARTVVTASADGVIGTAPHIGDYARAGVPVLNLVGSNNIWVEANYKETDLTNVKEGQPVTITVDTYPGREWKGHVESISPATGSEFSVLPAQNATGNWVKVVQRIAVKIALDDTGADVSSLRTGMSTISTIDIGYYPHALGGTAFAREE